jgi:hypothetical protein
MSVSISSIWSLAPILSVAVVAFGLGAILARGDDAQARRRSYR